MNHLFLMDLMAGTLFDRRVWVHCPNDRITTVIYNLSAGKATTPNLDASVEARIRSLSATASVTPTPNLLQTIEAAIAAALPTPTPDADAMVEARLQAILSANPTQSPSAPTATLPAELTSVIQQIRPSVVRIETPFVSGTGVIIETAGETGIVLTNFHVIEGTNTVVVTVDDFSVFEATVRRVDQVRDLAVLNICCGAFKAMKFGDASELQPGNDVVSMGYALGIEGAATVTRGIVSALRYDNLLLSDVI